jgi:tetratricopeptide (TPR) repeat protein
MWHMDAELAMLSRKVDPVTLGQRIKSARLAAGLTQKDLAGDAMSTAYISRIEDGQRRPSVKALERMAHQTGTTVAALVVDEPAISNAELQLALDHAELALMSGDARTALERAIEIEAETETETDGSTAEATAARALLSVDARYIRAAALEALGDLNQAIQLLEDITAKPEPTVRWVKALIALCRCHKEQGDFAGAIEIGERATPLIAELGLAGLTESIQLTVSVAGAHMKRGDLDQAIRICSRAVDAAERVDSPLAKASAYWNASLIEGRRGAHKSALTLAQRALASFEEGEDFRNIGRLRTQVASMQLRTNPPNLAAALERLNLAEKELGWSSASPMDKADHHLVLARARYLAHNIDDALRALAQAKELMGESAPLLRAEAETLQGRISFAVDDVAAARTHYGNAVRALSAVGSDRDAAQLWFELGGLLDLAGDRDGALDAYRSAAAATGLAPASADVNSLVFINASE